MIASNATGTWLAVYESDSSLAGTIGTDRDILFQTGTGPDPDEDGLADGAEVNVYGTDPDIADTDGDGLSDGDEVNVHGTDPLLADTDGDGFNDGVEVAAGTDPTDPLDFPAVPGIPVLSNSGLLILGGLLIFAVVWSSRRGQLGNA